MDKNEGIIEWLSRKLEGSKDGKLQKLQQEWKGGKKGRKRERRGGWKVSRLEGMRKDTSVCAKQCGKPEN